MTPSEAKRSELRRSLDEVYSKTLKLSSHTDRDKASIDDYSQLMRRGSIGDIEIEIWSDAIQAALDEHTMVIIPPRDEPYYVDKTLLIGSNRCITAHGARVIQTPDCDVIMLRNRSTVDGTHAPIPVNTPRDMNISIHGGYFAESRDRRMGYGTSGKYDKNRSFYGVSTLFFFNNMDYLTLTDITFAHTAGFSVQAGDITNAIFEHIRFEQCYADGLHINGNTENLICRDIKGQVGDDLVALNVYDWQNSSVDFGPMRSVLVEDLELSEDSRYKALRIEPGRYFFDDGSEVDCSLTDAIIAGVKGIRTFKMYYQTPRYKLGTSPERGAVGSMDNVFFENITADLAEPLDGFDEYKNSDPIRGSIGVFELGANIGFIGFYGIELTLHLKQYPYSYLAVVGPKSVRLGELEIFDPYLSSEVDTIECRDITVNGVKLTSVDELRAFIREVKFDDINRDGHSTGEGRVGKLLLK